jgi:hypothetical protein
MIGIAYGAQETPIKVGRCCTTCQGSSELRPRIEANLRHTIVECLRKTSRVPAPKVRR